MIEEYIRAVMLPKLASTKIYSRLTGITRVVSRQINDQSAARHSFPVACNTSGADVLNKERYKIFVPDSGTQSIGFFENSSYTIEESDDNQSQRAVYTLKFLAWYNLEKFGVSDCGIPISVITETIAALSTQQTINQPFVGCYATSRVSLIQDNNPQAAFSKYTFAGEDGIFLYPYAFAAFDVRVTIQYKKSCVPSAGINCACTIV